MSAVRRVHERRAASAPPRKDDKGKQLWRLLPWDALSDVVDVLTWACTREDPPPYGAGSWRGVPNAVERYEDALERHLVAWRHARARGEPGRASVDTQSGLPHLAHAACCLLFILALDR